MEKSQKIASIVLYILSAISIVLFVLMFFSIDDETNPGEKARSLMTTNINWAIVMLILATIVSLAFATIQILSDRASAINGIAVILGFGVLTLVSYLIATNELPQFYGSEKFVADGILSPSISRWIGAGLNMTYFLFAGAILSVVGFSVANMFKR